MATTITGSELTTQTVNSSNTEVIANKKSTLSENSEVYYPNQKAVNDGLNLTMAEMMGFAPRNLMDVFGTSTVDDTFAELRARSVTGDFSTLRLGDYIDLPSLTIPAGTSKPSLYLTRTLTWNASYENLRIEIVGFDDYFNVGNMSTVYPTQHHVTMMFKNIPTTAQFNETDTTTGDYQGSDLFAWLRESFEPALISAIGLEPRAVDRRIGTVANWNWVGIGEKIFLPTNVNIFGTTGLSNVNYATGTQTQFALFVMNPNRKIKKWNPSRSTWWLAEPSANLSTHFCSAGVQGDATNFEASTLQVGVVPTFLI